jgi:hypothetical protein
MFNKQWNEHRVDEIGRGLIFNYYFRLYLGGRRETLAKAGRVQAEIWTLDLPDTNPLFCVDRIESCQ